MLLISEAPNLFYSFGLQILVLLLAGAVSVAIYRLLGSSGGRKGKP